MWLITNKGLISTVQDRANPERLLVRARRLDHLADFLGTTEGIFEDHEADYPYRTYMSRLDYVERVFYKVDAIDYDNFKNSVEDHLLNALYSRVWGILSELGTGSRYGRRQRRLREIERLPREAFEDDGSLKPKYLLKPDPFGRRPEG